MALANLPLPAWTATPPPRAADRTPPRRLFLCCMDPRLDPLLHRALGIEPGDAWVLRTAGAGVPPAGEPLRSITLACLLFGVEEITIVGHRECRMARFDSQAFGDAFRARGISRAVFGAGTLRDWAGATASPREGVRRAAQDLRAAGSLPADVRLHGLLIDDAT